MATRTGPEISTSTSASTSTSTPVRILIINPNTSTHMTEALKPVVEGLGLPFVEYTFFTSPSPGIPSINSPTDAIRSAEICYPALLPLIPQYDAFLVACYSAHPLVGLLKVECARCFTTSQSHSHSTNSRKYVTGIFEASCLVSLNLVGDATNETETETDNYGFGIVSTGKIWESALQIAVQDFLGTDDIRIFDESQSQSKSPDQLELDLDTQTSNMNTKTNPTSEKEKEKANRFYGCETTGLNASELHDLPTEQVQRKMKDATKRLLRRGMTTVTTLTTTTNTTTNLTPSSTRSNVKAICLGCAGMVGLESAVRSACIEELGLDAGNAVYIVDGVKAGVGTLYALARCGF